MHPSQEKKTEASNYSQSLMASCISGLAAGYSGFYFESTKKRIQSNQVVPNPFKQGAAVWFRESFRGSGSYALSNVPSVVIQQVSSHFFAANNISNNDLGKTGEAIVSGALGGIPAAVIGNILLEQQLKQIGPKQACMNLIKEDKTRLFRGLSLMMIREAMFGFCYLKGIVDTGNYIGETYGKTYVFPAQLAIGVMGSLLSHPFDTMATTMQQFNYKSIAQARQHLWQENKLPAFYKGGASRIGLFTTTMVVIKEVREQVLEQLNP